MDTTYDLPLEAKRAARLAYQGQKADAQRRGRNPRWPYVPVIQHATGGIGNGPRQEQVQGYAYATRDEAVQHAAEVIAARREDLEHRLLSPRHRALRAEHGLPREVLR